jgi:hypothetical protein
VGFGLLIRLTIEAWGKLDVTLEVSRKSGAFPASNSLDKSSINLFPGMDFFLRTACISIIAFIE